MGSLIGLHGAVPCACRLFGDKGQESLCCVYYVAVLYKAGTSRPSPIFTSLRRPDILSRILDPVAELVDARVPIQ